MKLDIYLNYAGNCQQAFRFYEQHLGGKITMMMTHGQGPNAGKVPDEQKNTILHARLELGNTVVMGADIPKSEPMRSAYLTLTLDSEKEAERVYALLSEGGQIFMKMEKRSEEHTSELQSRLHLVCRLLLEKKKNNII